MTRSELKIYAAPSSGSNIQISYTVLGPATIYIKNLDYTLFPTRTVKTFSVATHLFRGIILNNKKISIGAPPII